MSHFLRLGSRKSRIDTMYLCSSYLLPITHYQPLNLHPDANDIYLVVEISNSSLTKVLEQKQPIYAAGIQEYGILDLTTLQLIVLRNPQVNEYQSRQNIKSGMIFPLAFPEITLSVEQFFSV